MHPALARFQPAVQEWFAETFEAPTRTQELAWPPIQSGRSTLVSAPTGSGKTLAAFLAALDRLMLPRAEPGPSGCRVLYVSPLRALAFDVERNLQVPLAGIARVAARRGETCRVPSVALRTGDTPASERARMLRTPPEILITTPESLFLVLTSRAAAMLGGVETVIVDEIHALCGNKRGAHLAISLERVEERAGRPLRRIGLSATQRPLETVASFLGGGSGSPQEPWRPVRIVDAGGRKAFDLRVEVPVEDMARLDAEASSGTEGRPSIWPAIHPRLLELIRSHTSTLLFVNSRRLAERLAAALNELAGETLVRAHHGSVAREERLRIEEALKAGRLPGLVATSTLELGIDMGAIDLVVQIETPPSVASGMQRIGRAGHQATAVSRGVVFPKYRGDLLATAAITRAMAEGEVEETRIPRNPLDVLAQQVVSIAAMGERGVDELFSLVRRAAPFAELPRSQLEGVLDMLSGRYPADEFAELRPRLTWDRLKDRLRAREGAARVVVTNAGTIPDRGLYGVFLAEGRGRGRSAGRRVGELDEEMVFESREGEVFVLGASSWRIVEITRDQVLVEPAPAEPGKMPFWKADRPPRPAELGGAIGRLTRELLAAPREAALARLVEHHALDSRAAGNLLAYLDEQRAATEAVPDDRTLVLERTRDELGDWRLTLLSPWGGRLHAPWALAIEARLRGASNAEVETIWSDDGIVIRLPDREDPPDLAALVPDPDEIESLVTADLPGTALFAAHFREAAARALLLPRRRPGQRTPLWMQRKRAADLLAVAARYPSFPMVLEAMRECLKEVFDVPALVDLARRVRRREFRLVTVDTQSPSPFSASLLFGYVANYLYDGDAPLAERRAQALAVDQRQLRELLGEAELRDLLDRDALSELEASLQEIAPGRGASSPDRLHDLLLRLGDLSLAELSVRVVAPGDASLEARRRLASRWVDALEREARVLRLHLAGEERVAAAEDAGKLRDAFGVSLPRRLPRAFLAKVPQALEAVLARHARTHGPFHAREVAERYRIDERRALGALSGLVASGRLLEGEFRPGAHGREFCDPGVLATLRRRSLARLRRQVEPASHEALARLLLGWQGVAATDAAPRGGPEALLDVVEQLQGAAFPASILEEDVLPARLPEYRSTDLDALCASGEVVWVGLSPLGERDGRVGLFLADDLPLLLDAGRAPLAGDLYDRIRGLLERRGASFFVDLHAGLGGLEADLLRALWDLVWAGEVVSDSPAALRAFLGLHRGGPARRSPRRLASYRSRRHAPPSGAGRFSLVAAVRSGKEPTPTERAKALAEQLLARHGVLSRGAVAAEGVPGGFAALYPVLTALEETGRVRRGYFVAGLGGSQFGDPGAVEMLRRLVRPESDEEGPAALLAAADPANPYGAALPWPREEARLQRAAGSHVALADGRLTAFLGRGEREIAVFLPDEEPGRGRVAGSLARGLASWCLRTGRSLLGWGGGASPLAKEPMASALIAAGFVRSGPGFRLRAASPARR